MHRIKVAFSATWARSSSPQLRDGDESFYKIVVKSHHTAALSLSLSLSFSLRSFAKHCSQHQHGQPSKRLFVACIAPKDINTIPPG